jgi:4-hydroxybenzoate polyprenyltransferase
MSSDPSSTENRLMRLEQKVNLLLVAAAIQVVTILMSWLNYFFGSAIWLLVLLVVIGALMYVFRHQLPELSGKLIRYVFSRREGGSESDREMM